MSDPAHVFTLGIEEEFQIIDPETRELRPHIQQILDDSKITLKEHVKTGDAPVGRRARHGDLS